MIFPDYFSDIARRMADESRAIRRDFASHHGSAGQNREGLVRVFLENHLPKRFSVDSGILVSRSRRFSKQADLVIVDYLHNAPLHGSSPNRLWPVEAVFALIEVKTKL